MRHCALSVPILVLFLSLMLAYSASAGISIGKGSIIMPSGHSAEFCDLWIYATQEGGTYHVETTGNLSQIMTGAVPNDFRLDPIECPQDGQLRRACIAELCNSGTAPSCKIVCVKFTAPLILEWEPSRIEYTGGILNKISIGAASISEPYKFSVFVDPMDVKPIALGSAAVIIIVLLAVFLWKRKTK
jgi:hypothetical protein